MLKSTSQLKSESFQTASQSFINTVLTSLITIIDGFYGGI